ncbi:MAG: adenylate/guanylate cyclase domain-containing protein [Dehalococcoidia bacterium]
MEPQIQYCRTSDGLSIAYYALGSGPALIGTAPSLGQTIAKDWEIAPMRRLAELTARTFTYIRYDPHGCGLSSRADDDLSVEAFVRDLEAVADAATPEPFVLFANGAMTAPAIVYAARHPERLTHLLLWMVFAYSGDYASPATQQIVKLALTDWRMATESGIRAVDSWEHDELASQMAAMMRESVTPETYVKFENVRQEWDVSQYLPQVTTPTLIMHPRNHPYFPATTAQRVAAAIPGARLALIDSSTVLFPDARIAFVAGEFLGTAGLRPLGAPTQPSGTATILFIDIADSTALTERMGDTAFRAASRELDERLRATVRDAGGAPVEGKVLGDGVLAVFTSAAQAIEAARSCQVLSAASELRLHIGLHAGDVIREADNVYGGAVNIAARICSASAPGEILVSDVIRSLARTSAGVAFEDRGEHALKGIDDPLRVYAVRADITDER